MTQDGQAAVGMQRLTDGIRRAGQHLLRAGPADIIADDPGFGQARALQRRPPGYQRNTLGLQRHAVPEICITLAGRAVLELAGRQYLLRPGRLAIIAPGLHHCEGRLRGRGSYLLLWIIPGVGNICCLHINRSSRARSWAPMHTFFFPSIATGRLLERFGEKRHLPESGRFEALRGDLLAVLGEAWSEIARLSETADGGSQPSGQISLVQQVEAYLRAHLHDPVSLRELESRYRMNRDYLGRLFRRATGLTPLAYLTKHRMEVAARLCRTTRQPIKQIALSLGYQDPLYFSRVFRQFHGKSPRAARTATPVSGRPPASGV